MAKNKKNDFSKKHNSNSNNTNAVNQSQADNKSDTIPDFKLDNTNPVNKEINNDTNKDETKPRNTIEDILLNMKIISEINENDKLLTNNECLEIDTRYFQSFQRWWYEDGRDNTLIKLDEIIKMLFSYIDQNYNSNDNNTITKNFKEGKTHLFQRIHRSLSNSIKGLENLKTTYKDDIKTISKVDLLIEKINIKIERMSQRIKIT
tara:strand:+ start:256 stop:870 length:615 start_codon:yes stop_codon:yes gene_type:complete